MSNLENQHEIARADRGEVSSSQSAEQSGSGKTANEIQIVVDSGQAQTSGNSMDLKQIMSILPHRPPFLLIDKVTFYDGVNEARGLKNLTSGEFFFQNHFGDSPELPKPILIEIMAQLGAVCVLNQPEYKGKLILFASIDDCTFGKAPVPGDVLDLRVENRGMRRGMGRMLASCYVDNELRAQGMLMFAITEKEQ